MKARALLSLVAQSLSRARVAYVASALGVCVGVASLVFFIGLGEGVRRVVLDRVLVAQHVEVVRKSFDAGPLRVDSIFGLGATPPLDANAVAALAGIEGVAAALPRARLTFPARAAGGRAILGQDLVAELIADGVAPESVAASTMAAGVSLEHFVDPEARRACGDSSECPGDGQVCEAGRCNGLRCVVAPEDAASSDHLKTCPGESACAVDLGRCLRPIPALASPHALELYNSSLVSALSGAGRPLPRLTPSALIGLQLEVTFGEGFIGRSSGAPPLTRRVKLVGFADAAILVGLTLPLSVVQRLNARFNGPAAGLLLHGVLLDVPATEDLPRVVSQVRGLGFELSDRSENVEQAGRLIRLVTALLSLVSGLIVALAALGMTQAFFVAVQQRRRELAVLKALGAAASDIRAMVLLEAAIIGALSGASGLLLGRLSAWLADIAAIAMPHFPFKPMTFFDFPVWIWPAGLGFAVAACVLGAFVPARAAARADPAQALNA